MKIQYILIKNYLQSLISRLQGLKLLQGYSEQDPILDMQLLARPQLNEFTFGDYFIKKSGVNKDEMNLAFDNKILQDVAYQHSKNIDNTIIKFFEGETTGQFTNMQLFTPAQYEHTLIMAIRVFYAIGDTELDEAAYTPGLTTADTQNGTLTIKTNKDTYLFRLDLAAFIASASQITGGVFYLTEYIPWVAQQTLDLSIEMPNIPAAFTKMRIQLLGKGLI